MTKSEKKQRKAARKLADAEAQQKRMDELSDRFNDWNSDGAFDRLLQEAADLVVQRILNNHCYVWCGMCSSYCKITAEIDTELLDTMVSLSTSFADMAAEDDFFEVMYSDDQVSHKFFAMCIAIETRVTENAVDDSET